MRSILLASVALSLVACAGTTASGTSSGKQLNDTRKPTLQSNAGGPNARGKYVCEYEEDTGTHLRNKVCRYIDDENGYVGGFSAAQIEELLQFLESNHMGWSAQMAPAIMGNPDRPELGEELTNSFCRTDPEIAKAFARVTFTSDNRKDLAGVDIPVLVLQCSEDIIASQEVGEFVNRNLSNSRMIVLNATGHCPNLSAPQEVIGAMRTFV